MGVLHDAFAHAKSQIQTAKRGIAFLEPGHNAQGVKVVVEAQPVRPKSLIQRLFPGMAKGRMPNVVSQRQCFGKFPIQPQTFGQRAGYLRHFQRVGQPAAKVISQRLSRQTGKHLRLSCQAAKSPRMQNAGPIPGKGSAIRMRLLAKTRCVNSLPKSPYGNPSRQSGLRFRFPVHRSIPIHGFTSGYTAAGD